MDNRVRHALSGLVQANEEPEATSDGLSEGAEKSTRCRPWSQSDFRLRLESFSNPSQWFAKPACIGPMQCARFGWCNSGTDLLKCESCSEELNFAFGGELSIDEGEDAASAFSEYLSVGHAERCPWRSAPSPMSFATFPESSANKLRVEFQSSCDSITAQSTSESVMVAVPSELVSIVESEGSDIRSLLSFPEGSLESQSVPISEGGAEVASLFGWRPSSRDTSGSLELECKLCCRCVRLGSSSNAADEPPTAKRSRLEANSALDSQHQIAKFDPEGEHRWYCPWVRAPPLQRGVKAGSEPVSVPGWQKALAAAALKKSGGPDSTSPPSLKAMPENEVRMGSLRSFLNKI